MKPKPLKVSIAPSTTISVRFDALPYFYKELHFHPEIEIVLVHKGTGTQFVGNTLKRFKDGDLTLLGSNVPHLWKCDDAYFKQSKKLKAEATVIHFLPETFGNQFWSLPENEKIKQLFEHAQHGINIIKQTKVEVAALMQQMLQASATERLILLHQLLHIISISKHRKLISSKSIAVANTKENNRFNNVLQYLTNHYTEPIDLATIAKVAHLTPPAFCRYFKKRTKQSFSTFLKLLRMQHACKLLAETDMPVGTIVYESGYNNVSNFNKHFKEVIQQTPLTYRKQFN
ncbi:MAG TPA: AraC family transcriptional regulator [Chitinophagaceae bacterium]|nr:AraC family transcriptional regulator [Chitinophagaceae bacterium]